MEPLPEMLALPELAEALTPAVPPAPPVAAPAAARGARGPAAGMLERGRRWAKLLSAYFTAQALTQLLGVSAGLLLVRTMPVRQFALYTLALSMVTFFTFLSDLGSTTSLLYFFHRSAGAESEFPLYFAAVRSLRRLAFLGGAVAVVAALPRAALAKGFGGAEIALATAGVLACVWFQINASLSVLALRLADRYGESYRAEIAGGVMRLASAAALIAVSRLVAWLAVLGNAAAIATVSLLARPAAAVRQPTRALLAPYRRRILRYLLPTLPSALYFSLQGPLVVWLSATFGATRNIAEVGALSRLGMLVGLLSNLSGIVLLPRLARIADERLYRRRCLQFGAFLAATALALYLAVLAFPHALLALLGEHYAGLDGELLLVVCGAGISLVGGYVMSVNLARSWTRWQGATVAVMAVAQALLVKALPLGTTRGVLIFNVLGAGLGLTMQAIVLALGFTRPKAVHWE